MRKALQQAGVARNGPGRPKFEDIVPQLPALFMKLIAHNCVADPRMRNEIIRHLGTVRGVTKELNEELAKIPELKKIGFKVSKSATYTMFVPRHPNSYEARRHPYCLPVRSARAQFDWRANHVSLRFCNARNRNAKRALAWFSLWAVFISPEDKALIPLGTLQLSSKKLWFTLRLQLGLLIIFPRCKGI